MDGATVTFTNTATNASQSATTDANGGFTFSNLAPGTYRVAVKMKSGLQLSESSIEISSAGSNQVQVDFAQTAAAPAAKLELDGRAPTLQTHSAEVSRSYDSNTIRSLPVIDRQNQELISLMPGVTPPVIAGDRINDPQQTRTFNVNGQPAYSNLQNQDGAYNNEPFYGRAMRVEPDEAVQALQVRTSNYNAEYGLAGGSWSSTLTRPGTNALHGSLFEFNTNSYFRTGRSLEASQSSPRFNSNDFGGTAGGAVLPDRMFWFLSYEGLMQRGSQEAEATVPMAGLSSGNFSQVAGVSIFNPASGNISGIGRTPFTGNLIPSSQLNRSAQQILALIPSANAPGYYNNLVGSVPLLDDNHRIDAKLDHRFSEKSTGFFRYGFTQGSVDQGSLLGSVGSPLNSELRGMNAVGSYTHLFSTNFMAELRMGYGRYRNQVSPWGDFSGLNGITAFPNGLPSINIAGFSPLGLPSNVPRKEISNVYDGSASMGYHTGMHNLKFGVDVQSLQSNGFANPFFSSYSSFIFGSGATLGSTASAAGLSPAVLQANALAGFLLGAPNQGGIANYTSTPAYRQMSYSAYLSDTVTLAHRLYLELGARYDIFSPVEPNNPGGAVVYDPASNTVTSLGMNGVGMRSTRTDVNNIAPRIGLAFRPTERFVFRAGYGIHYFSLPFSEIAFNPDVMGTQVGLAGGLGTTTFTTPTVPASAATAPNLPYRVGQRSVSTPYLQTYSAMLQGDLGNGFLLDVGYVGNVGRQLPYSLNHFGQPGSGIAGLNLPVGRTALYNQFDSGLTSNFNSMQVNLTKRFAAGLSLSGAYTWGKALDYGGAMLDPYSRSANYGPADWDRTHILTVSHDWRLPFGVRGTHFKTGLAARMLGDWEMTGILRWATGNPYSVTADPLACACFGVGSVPVSFNQSGSGFNGASSFDPTQFSSSAPGTFGAFSRNGFRGPDMFTYNAALFRNFAINENIKFELRGEVYNLTNTTNLANPIASFSQPGFGTTIGSANGMAGRQFQVAGRILF